MAIDLNQIKIASPCKMNWNEMKGDERVRHCGSCNMNVYSLAGLSREEAQDLLQKAAGGERVCVRFRRRADGTVMTNDCPVGVSAIRRARLKIASLIATLASGAMWFSSQKSSASQPEPSSVSEPISQPQPRHIMGKIQAPKPETKEIMGGLGFSHFEEPLNQEPPQPVPTIVEPDDELETVGEVMIPDETTESYEHPYSGDFDGADDK